MIYVGCKREPKSPLIAIVGISMAISEIKQTEELRRSEERFRATFAQAAVGMAHTAPDGRLLRVNRKLCDILGYTREEMLGMTVQERTHPDDFERDLDQARRLLAGEIETYSMEKRFFRKDDSIVWINLTVSLVRQASAEPDYFIAVVEDIDERKRTEIDLDREREFLKATLESLKVGIVACDAEGNLTLFNKASREFHGVAEEKSARQGRSRRLQGVRPCDVRAGPKTPGAGERPAACVGERRVHDLLPTKVPPRATG
jgi:PAS domain S-box-containing protein